MSREKSIIILPRGVSTYPGFLYLHYKKSMAEIIALTGAEVVTRSGKHDRFYVKNCNGCYYLGFVQWRTGERHELRISEDFYTAFIKERENNLQRSKDVLKYV